MLLGSEQTHRILNDATYAIENWKPDGTKVRRTLTSHHGRNPLVSKNKALPPSPTTLTDNNNNNESDTETKDEDADENNNKITENEHEKNDTTIETNEDHDENESSSLSLKHQKEKHGIEKQESFYSLHKPDAVDENNNNYEGVDDSIPPLPSSPRFAPATVYTPNMTGTHPDHAGGFSTVYLVKIIIINM